MTTFDGWDTRYCGDSMALPPGTISKDYLMHWRTRGSKNGQRRYQNEDGSWTPLGLRLRKEREGWGETKKEQKAAKKEQKAQSQAEKMANRYAKAAKRVDRANARDQARRERQERLNKRYQQRSLKNVSDDELKRMIDRVKMEREYKELTRSPLLVAGEKMIQSYVAGKKEKLAREERMAKMEKEMTEAKARLVTAEADKAYAAKRGNVQARKISAKAEFKKAKNEERKHTIRGAISQVQHDIIQKRGSLHVKKIEKTYGDIVKNGAKRVGRIFDKSRDWTVSKITASIERGSQGRKDSKPWYGSVWDGNSKPKPIKGSPRKKAKALAKEMKGWDLEDRSTYQTSGKKHSSGYTYEEPSGSGWTSSGYRRNSLTAAEQNRHNMNANRYKSKKRRR